MPVLAVARRTKGRHEATQHSQHGNEFTFVSRKSVLDIRMVLRGLYGIFLLDLSSVGNIGMVVRIRV